MVEAAACTWAAEQAAQRDGLLRLGIFGSYARGDAGVGSDLDLIAVVRSAEASFERRALDWDLLDLPVPAQILVYTEAEWAQLLRGSGRFATTLRREVRWLVGG